MRLPILPGGGEKGRASYIAVVHADGNGMGQRIAAFTSDEDNWQMVAKMRQISGELNQIGLEAMDAVCSHLRKEHKANHLGKYYLPDRWLENEAVWFKDNFLPLRPIVFGGDDIAFISDGPAYHN